MLKNRRNLHNKLPFNLHKIAPKKWALFFNDLRNALNGKIGKPDKLHEKSGSKVSWNYSTVKSYD